MDITFKVLSVRILHISVINIVLNATIFSILKYHTEEDSYETICRLLFNVRAYLPYG